MRNKDYGGHKGPRQMEHDMGGPKSAQAEGKNQVGDSNLKMASNQMGAEGGDKPKPQPKAIR